MRVRSEPAGVTAATPPEAPSSEVVFYLNGSRVALRDPDPALLLVDYLRSRGLTGTKLSCGEGGCGACTVMVGRWDRARSRVVRRSVNACLRPVASIDGMAITTVEGIGNTHDGLNPVQHSLASGNGSQCGYCSPGFVMTAYAYLREHERPSEQAIEELFAGNLCRCTGYRPILDAMRSFASPPYAAGVAADTFPEELCDRAPRPLHLHGGGRTWYRATTLQLMQELKERHWAAPNDPKLVSGNTSIGIYKADDPRVLIDVGAVEELRHVGLSADGAALEVGGAVTYTELRDALAELRAERTAVEVAGLDALDGLVAPIAGTQVRDEATVGGAVSLLWQHAAGAKPFPSDLYTALVGLDATVALASRAYDGGRRAFGSLELPPAEAWPHDAVVETVRVPLTGGGEHVATYRVARREQNAHALVNACLWVRLGDARRVEAARLAFGAIAGRPVRATATEQALAGRPWNGDALTGALDALHGELEPLIIEWHDGISRGYRLGLAESLFYRFFLAVSEVLAPGAVAPALAGGAYATPRPVSSGREDIQRENAIPKLTAPRQTAGEEIYTTDTADPPGTVFGALVASAYGHASFEYAGGVDAVLPALQERFDGVLAYLTAADIPCSYTGIGGDDPVFVTDTATAYGQLVGIVVAEDARCALAAAAHVQHDLIAWSPLPAVLGIDAARTQMPPSVLPNPATPPKQWLSYVTNYTRAGSDPAWLADPLTPPPGADGVLSGVQRSGLQAHFYMEPQALIAQPSGDGGILVDASTQSPDMVQNAVRQALNLRQNQVRVRVHPLGGGFGGKTTRSPFVATPVALAAWTLNQPVRLAIDRNVDTAIIGKRHAFEGAYHVAYKDGEIVAMTTALAADGGNTIDCSYFVIHVAQLHADNCYLVPTFGVGGTVYKTNEASNISMRAFGVVQTILIQEDAIEQVGYRTGTSPEAIRRRLLYRSGDSTHYGEQLEDCPIRENWDRLMRDADFELRAEEVARFNAANRWKKRGIAMIPLKYGAQYEVPALNYGSSLASVYAGDGSVVVQCGGVEVGQGLQTKVAQIAARTLGIDVHAVTVADADTSVTANATSTGADSGADLNGWATYIAAHQLRKRLEAFAHARGLDKFRGATWEAKWPEIVSQAHAERVDLAAYAFYKTKGIAADKPYAFYTWSVGCSEVEVDVLTGQVTVLRADLLVDAGLPLNPRLDLGQAQGAFVQGLGYMFTEEVLFDDQGRLLTDGTWEYKPPCSHTIPVDFRVSLNVARPPVTTLPIEHTVALVAAAGPAAFRPDVAVLAQHAMLAKAGDPPAVPAGSPAAADPAVVEQVEKIQVLTSADIAADPELRQQLDEATAAALHSAKNVGEPPVALAVSALLAVKRAVLSARADAGADGWFELDAPATVERVREACATPRDQLRL
jgi:xanthine dehydrogenase/oxidase